MNIQLQHLWHNTYVRICELFQSLSEMTVSRFWNIIPSRVRLAFFSSCVWGFFVHLFQMTNLIPNHDGVVMLKGDNNFLILGRWSLKTLSSLSTDYTLPVLLCLISILALALCTVFTVEVMELSSSGGIILASGMILSYPSAVSIFSYLFTADAYFIALLLCAFGVWLAKKYRFGWIPCIFMIATAIGSYQAFICFAVGLFLVDCILQLYNNTPVKTVVKKGIQYILIAIASVAAYWLLLQLSLRIHHVTLSNHQGIGEVFSTSPILYLKQIPIAYRLFWHQFWEPPYLLPAAQTAQKIFLILLIASAVFLWIQRGCWKSPLKSILLVIGFALLPAALNLISIIMVNGVFSTLITYAFVLLNLLCIKLMEMSISSFSRTMNKSLYGGIFRIIAAAAAIVLLWGYVCLANTGYLRMKICYENTFALANRIAARLETMEEFSPETPVAIVGTASVSNQMNLPEAEALTGTDNKTFINYYTGAAFLRSLIGLDMASVNAEQIEAIHASGILETMPLYPAKESIQAFNGCIIIKLDDSGIIW